MLSVTSCNYPITITLASTTWCITSVSLLAAMSHLERWAPSKQSWHSPQQSPRLSPSPHPRAASHRVHQEPTYRPQHSPQRSLSPHPPQGPPQHTPATWRKSRICSRGVVTFWTLRRQMSPVLIAKTSRSYLNISSWHRSLTWVEPIFILPVLLLLCASFFPPRPCETVKINLRKLTIKNSRHICKRLVGHQMTNW